MPKQTFSNCARVEESCHVWAQTGAFMLNEQYGFPCVGYILPALRVKFRFSLKYAIKQQKRPSCYLWRTTQISSDAIIDTQILVVMDKIKRILTWVLSLYHNSHNMMKLQIFVQYANDGKDFMTNFRMSLWKVDFLSATLLFAVLT